LLFAAASSGTNKPEASGHTQKDFADVRAGKKAARAKGDLAGLDRLDLFSALDEGGNQANDAETEPPGFGKAIAAKHEEEACPIPPGAAENATNAGRNPTGSMPRTEAEAGESSGTESRFASKPETLVADDDVVACSFTPQPASLPLPQWRFVSLKEIGMHPALARLCKDCRIDFPPTVPYGYLTAKGILAMARFLPIQIVTSEENLLCFGGVRLWLAAANALPADSSIEALIYPCATEIQIAEALEIEHDLLYVWHRQSRAEREEQETRYQNSTSPNQLRIPCDGDQKLWEKIFRTSLRTLQNRKTIRRKNR
jgi:hypothetical protein